MIEWDNIAVTFLMWSAIVPIEAFWIVWWFERRNKAVLALVKSLQPQKKSWWDRLRDYGRK